MTVDLKNTYFPITSRSVDDMMRRVKTRGKPKPKSSFKKYPVQIVHRSGLFYFTVKTTFVFKMYTYLLSFFFQMTTSCCTS